jgi:hypothetical protein
MDARLRGIEKASYKPRLSTAVLSGSARRPSFRFAPNIGRPDPLANPRAPSVTIGQNGCLREVRHLRRFPVTERSHAPKRWRPHPSINTDQVQKCNTPPVAAVGEDVGPQCDHRIISVVHPYAEYF